MNGNDKVWAEREANRRDQEAAKTFWEAACERIASEYNAMSAMLEAGEITAEEFDERF